MEKKYGIDRVLARWTDAVALRVSWATVKKWRREDPRAALQRLLSKYKSQAELGAALGVTQRTISVWLQEDIPLDERPARPMNQVEQAVEKAGGQPAVAAEFGVTQQCVSRWCKDGYMPVARAQEMEHLYGVPRTSLINPKLRNAMGVGEEL